MPDADNDNKININKNDEGTDAYPSRRGYAQVQAYTQRATAFSTILFSATS